MVRITTGGSLKITVSLIICSLFMLQIPLTAVYAAQAGSKDEPIPLKLNKPVTGTISTPGESNWYKFNATKGDSYVIEISNESVSMAPFFTLYSGNKSESILVWGSRSATYNFTSTGAYLIEVKHTDSTYGVGAYDISIRRAEPPTLVVVALNANTSKPILGATVNVYNPVSYKLLGSNVTDSDGVTVIPLKYHGYYLVTVSADGYDDIYGVTLLTGEGRNNRFAGMASTSYTGFVFTSALVKGVVTPGGTNSVSISIANVNATYPILLRNITIALPWFGFYNGNIQGLLIVNRSMPVRLDPQEIQVFSIQFTAPTDVTAYISSALTTNSFADFNGEALAWRTTYRVIEGVGLKENRTLVSVPINPQAQASQGFRVQLEGFSTVPVADPALTSKLDDVTANTKESNNKLSDIGVRIGDMGDQLASTSSSMKKVASSLNNVSSTLSSSDGKLNTISTGVGSMSNQLKAVNTQLDNVTSAVSNLASQQKDTNSKLTDITQKMTTLQKNSEDSVNRLYSDLRTLLILIAVITAVIAVATVLSLIRSRQPRMTYS
ncbi:MAG: hypothetical protein M1503_05485 [Thaumarchaeota archaeon]|nr:hypothetical protein [Nitrososphaerota archaeon]MCL5317702.1 hypothetical protein [Nitrososphaerota archaeon]